jgi:hypothetical protein
MSDDVTVTRNWGDWRKLAVPEEALSGFHITSTAGGTKARLPRPSLAAYMSCEQIPDDVEFGHSCQHGQAPHSIKVLIMKSHNPAAVYRRLREKAESEVTE